MFFFHYLYISKFFNFYKFFGITCNTKQHFIPFPLSGFQSISSKQSFPVLPAPFCLPEGACANPNSKPPSKACLSFCVPCLFPLCIFLSCTYISNFRNFCKFFADTCSRKQQLIVHSLHVHIYIAFILVRYETLVSTAYLNSISLLTMSIYISPLFNHWLETTHVAHPLLPI